jgi:hypothetical protein
MEDIGKFGRWIRVVIVDDDVNTRLRLKGT